MHSVIWRVITQITQFSISQMEIRQKIKTSPRRRVLINLGTIGDELIRTVKKNNKLEPWLKIHGNL